MSFGILAILDSSQNLQTAIASFIGVAGAALISWVVSIVNANNDSQLRITQTEKHSYKNPEWKVESIGTKSAYIYKIVGFSGPLKSRVYPGDSFLISGMPNSSTPSWGVIYYKRYKWAPRGKIATFGTRISLKRSTKISRFNARSLKILKRILNTCSFYLKLRKTSKELRKFLRISKTSLFTVTASVGFSKTVPHFYVKESLLPESDGAAYFSESLDLPMDYLSYIAKAKIFNKPTIPAMTKGDLKFDFVLSESELKHIAKYLPSFRSINKLRLINRPKTPEDFMRIFQNYQMRLWLKDRIVIAKKSPVACRTVKAYKNIEGKRIVRGWCCENHTDAYFKIHKPSYTSDNSGMLFKTKDKEDGGKRETVFIGNDGLVIVKDDKGAYQAARLNRDDLKQLKFRVLSWKDW